MDITILTVSWHSAEFLQDLINNLRAKASKPECLNILIIDNSNGEDHKMSQLQCHDIPVNILKNDPGPLKNLSAHASGLNFGFNAVNSDYTLVLDPDIHVFKQDWDTFLINEINNKQIDAIGTEFPPWWLGTYHNFPSPVFCFAKTSSLQKISANWLPPKRNIIIKIRNFICRQILRGAFLFNRRQLERYHCSRSFTKTIEKLLPTCSIDTGYPLAMQAKRGKIKSKIFHAVYQDELKDIPPTFNELASQYELYTYESEIILTHQYGSQNFLLRTQKGADRKYWRKLIESVSQ